MTPRRRRFRAFNASELVLVEHAMTAAAMPTSELVAGIVEEIKDELAMRDRFRSCAVHDMEVQLVGNGVTMATCSKCGAPGWTEEDFDRAMGNFGY